MYKIIENFEDLQNICIMVYKKENYGFILSKKLTYDYIQNHLVYLLIKDYDENAYDLGQIQKTFGQYKEYCSYFLNLSHTSLF